MATERLRTERYTERCPVRLAVGVIPFHFFRSRAHAHEAMRQAIECPNGARPRMRSCRARRTRRCPKHEAGRSRHYYNTQYGTSAAAREELIISVPSRRVGIHLHHWALLTPRSRHPSCPPIETALLQPSTLVTSTALLQPSTLVPSTALDSTLEASTPLTHSFRLDRPRQASTH